MRRLLGVWGFWACFLLGPGAVGVDAQPIDRWHFITEDSVLHAPGVAGLHGAGLIQSDQIFAMLYLGLPGENGVVSVTLPTAGAAQQLTSVLVQPNGRRFERALTAQDFDSTAINREDHAYSFPISDADLQLFKSARSWMLLSDTQAWTLTLTGSRRAIEAAEREREQVLSRAKAADAQARDR